MFHFNESQATQTTFNDGLQVFKFSNGQIEKHYPDGSKQIAFPDGSMRYILADGYEETYYQDGSVQKIDTNGIVSTEGIDGIKKIKYPDGKEEIINSNEDGEKYENNIFHNIDNALGSKTDMDIHDGRNIFLKNNEEDKIYELNDKLINDFNKGEKNTDDNNIMTDD